MIFRRFQVAVERHDCVLVDQRVHIGRQKHRGRRRVTAFDRSERLGDRILVGAGVDGLDFDPRVVLFEVGGEGVDDSGDRPADGDRVVERDLYRRLRQGNRRKGGNDKTGDAASKHVAIHDASSS